MKILALDDSEPALEMLTEAIREAVPPAEVFPFTKPTALLEFARGTPCDIAFLDIRVWGMNGLEVAAALKKMNPAMNIIFVTAYKQYQGEALDMRASGYVMKPATKEAVQREMENLRHPVDRKAGARIYVQTFGHFEVFAAGRPVAFRLKKSKEALAFLVDRNGASVSAAELAGILWPDREYDRYLQNQTQKIIAEMMKILRENGIAEIIIKKWNQISVDKSKFGCDYYEFLECDAGAVNRYRGEYMFNYSWAEMTTAALSQKAGMV